jgi:hypothetical protein
VKLCQAVAITCAALCGCSSPQKQHSLKHQPLAMTEQKSSETAEARHRFINEISAEYLLALRKSIQSLDDNRSSADVIARAAVEENIELLRERDRKLMESISKYSPTAAIQVAEYLRKIPTEDHISVATYMVLKLRKVNTLR